MPQSSIRRKAPSMEGSHWKATSKRPSDQKMVLAKRDQPAYLFLLEGKALPKTTAKEQLHRANAEAV